MAFKVGDKVQLINISSMAAPLGAIAVVSGLPKGIYKHCIEVKWESNVNNQMNGFYGSYIFKTLPRKGLQLEFTFMESEI